MRKQMDGLSTLVREAIKRDPKDGELYLFRNRNRSMIRILFYDHGGYCLLAKRLCKGRFRIEVEEADGASSARGRANDKHRRVDSDNHGIDGRRAWATRYLRSDPTRGQELQGQLLGGEALREEGPQGAWGAGRRR
ncbi:MAG: IS66 family insertion sequence element accessory protein TnpB, partial [Myxococcales bacterium]|nr:IS66 family insertion sequence element accessory protein TnpB [Myxococcales bacterium]